MRRTKRALCICTAVSLLAGAALAGPIVPFTETFAADNANWTDASGLNPATFVPTGGADGAGDGYISATFNFVNSAVGDNGAVLVRGNAAAGASGGAFGGDWISAGVTEFSFMVRHNAPVPISFFARLAHVGNFPAAIGVPFAVAPPNVWTPLSIAIFDGSPNFVTFEGSDFATIFSAIERIQLAVATPEALAGVDQVFVFDFDNPSIVPEPQSLTGLALLGLLALRRRTSPVA